MGTRENAHLPDTCLPVPAFLSVGEALGLVLVLSHPGIKHCANLGTVTRIRPALPPRPQR